MALSVVMQGANAAVDRLGRRPGSGSNAGNEADIATFQIGDNIRVQVPNDMNYLDLECDVSSLHIDV